MVSVIGLSYMNQMNCVSHTTDISCMCILSSYWLFI